MIISISKNHGKFYRDQTCSKANNKIELKIQKYSQIKVSKEWCLGLR